MRARLAIPADAARVLVVGESTHWDPNWLLTSEGYWKWRVRRTLDRAIDELVADERRVFGIECVFFLRMYWDRSPHRRDTIRRLVNTRRIQLTGSGVTTPDTVLPSTEAILRDFLVGQEWLRANGMTQEPRLAYFPDSFGHSPALASLLVAMGCDRAGVTRVDGMFFPGCDWEPPGRFPRPDSSAETLTRLRAADFVWRDASGAEVLCHWNAFGYGQAELLSHRGATRVMGLPFAVPDRSDANIARRIDRYAADLERVSPTPYLFAPMGYDFSMPLTGLVGLLDRYNRHRYGETGTWAVCAGLDDHLSLVDCRRDEVPVVELDPNPYWTGFYTSRPTLKRSSFRLVDDLVLADALGVATAHDQVAADLEDPWYVASVTNHHDWITGTSPDRVVAREQQPWLERASAQTARVLTRLERAHPAPVPDSSPDCPPWHRAEDGGVVVEVASLTFSVDNRFGGTVSAVDETGEQLLGPGSFDVVEWEDEGGLWRMGHEFAGGRLAQVGSATTAPADLAVAESDGGLVVTTTFELGTTSVRRELVFRHDLAGVLCRTEARVARRHTRTVRLAFDPGDELLMDCPGGQVRRPRQRWYRPTFWPLHSWVRFGTGVALASEYPAAVAVTADDRVDVVVGRNATHERAWGRLPIPGMPAPGHDDGTQVCEFAVLVGSEGFGPPERPWHRGQARRALHEAAFAAVEIDGAGADDVEVLTVKAAHRGGGVIVRFAGRPPWGRNVRLRMGGGVGEATRCDARERDLGPLEVVDGYAVVPLEQAITTVRLRPL